MDYRVNIRVRNERILSSIEKAGHEPGGKLASLIGVQYIALNNLINMTAPATKKSGELTDVALKLCTFLNKMPEQLFTQQQMYSGLPINGAEITMDEAQVENLLCGQVVDPLTKIIRDESSQCVSLALDLLHAREAQVLRMRYGFDGDEQTLEQIANFFGLTRERVRQIERKALRKLNHPSRRSILLSDNDALAHLPRANRRL